MVAPGIIRANQNYSVRSAGPRRRSKSAYRWDPAGLRNNFYKAVDLIYRMISVNDYFPAVQGLQG